MYSAWAQDIDKFAPGLSCSLAYADQREEAFKLKTDVVIINIDGVKWLLKNQSVLKDFDHLVIDEITAYKHASSQRSKAMVKLRKPFKLRYGMTGTPNPISVTELWNPTMIIDDGQRLGESFYRFRSIMQEPTQVGPMANHLQWNDKPGAAQAVRELLADIVIRHAFEDVMTHVPPNHRDTKTFQLSKRAQTMYERMENDAVIALESGTVTAVHAAALRTKLLQIASGAVYTTGDGAYEVIDTLRYELITDLVEEREHSVVFFNWRHQRDQLIEALTARKIKHAVIDGATSDRHRNEIVQAYQAGRFQTVLLHPKTGAHGLTMTRGDTTILSSPIYEADLLKQAVHRIYRGGQTKVTNTILIEAENTVEKLVYERLLDKHTRMVELLDLIKQRRR
jgi:SNF2 family DNA or RNA helicase